VLKTYYRLTKPGIVYGNAVTVIAGFFLASRGDIDWVLLLEALGGISLVIASACVFNNYIDRDIDKKMARTKKRALASGNISAQAALSYAAILGAAGFSLLYFYTNLLTTLVAAVGFVFYVIFYGWAKRHSVHGTLVGSVSGAVPPVVGYCAVSNNLDTGAWLLFLIMVCWQMPHFYAIAIYRRDDYASAGLPVLPVSKGIKAAKIQIVAYVIAFVAATVLLWTNGYTGYTYLLVVLLMGGWWLRRGILGFSIKDDAAWARKMFFQSLIIITVFSAVLALDWWLP
jgi:protoheme IX farnesyltransferase